MYFKHTEIVKYHHYPKKLLNKLEKATSGNLYSQNSFSTKNQIVGKVKGNKFILKKVFNTWYWDYNRPIVIGYFNTDSKTHG